MDDPRKKSTVHELFSRNLRHYRKLGEYSQAQLAEECKISTHYLADVETGRKFPSPAVIAAMASALQIEIYQLFVNSLSVSVKPMTLEEYKELLRQDLIQTINKTFESH